MRYKCRNRESKPGKSKERERGRRKTMKLRRIERLEQQEIRERNRNNPKIQSSNHAHLFNLYKHIKC